jgi:hypothetical protein
MQLGGEFTRNTTELAIKAGSKDTEMGPPTRTHPSQSDLEEGVR